MEKSARKKSQDPVQEKLREEKSLWNKEVSQFIDNLIHFKKMMNGWPSKFYMERSPIGTPIPKSPETIIGALAGDFQDIAAKSNDIISRQIDYSKTRRKKKVIAPGVAPVTPSTADLEYDLIAEGSGRISRMLSRLKGPFFGKSPEARRRKYRLSMLKQCVILEKKLKILESEIMGSSPESIFKSSLIFRKISSLVNNLENELLSYTSGSMPEGKKEIKDIKDIPAELPLPQEKKIEAPVKKDPEIVVEEPLPKSIKAPVIPNESNLTFETITPLVEDYKNNRGNFLEIDPNLTKKMFANYKLFEIKKKNGVENKALFKEIYDLYHAILNDLRSKLKVSGNSLEEIKMNRKVASSNEAMNKFAQSLLKKWWGQAKHFLSSDESTAKRSDIVEISERTRDRIQAVMDSLEEGVDVSFLAKEIAMLKSEMQGLDIIINSLLESIKGLKFDKPFMDLLEGRKILDYESGLDEKNRELVKRKINQELQKDFMKLYRGLK